jgi:hypothetical protein
MPAASELLDRLRLAQTAAAAQHALHQLEDNLAPGEIAGLVPALRGLAGLAKIACESSSIIRELHRAVPQPYTRHDLASGVSLFSTSEPPRKEKALIVAFCGRTNRLMVPRSLFLQFVPASVFDVVILNDRNNDHYFAGIEGYAHDLWSLVKRTLSDVSASSYRRLYCYGTSSGGFAALRFGLLAGAYRAISVGGTYPWPIHQLEGGKSLDAFDPLCACNPQPRSHVVCVHASDALRDKKSAIHLQRIMKVSRVPVDGTDDHNIVYKIYMAGGLATFNAQLFDFDPRLVRLSRPHSVGSSGNRGQGAAGVPS